jgi:hypothetical protein
MNNKATLQINGQSYLLTFGLKFLELLNSKYTLAIDGLAVGAGLVTVWTELKMQNPVMIRDMILFATATNVNRPSEDEVETYIFEQLEDEEKAVALFSQFGDFLTLAPGARRFIKAAEEATQASQPEKAPAKKATKKTASK